MLQAASKTPVTPTRQAFHQAIADRGDQWYAACLRITRDPDLAGDAVQDALLSAWQKRHQFEGGARLETWIHRIAVNAALQLVRKQHPVAWESLEADMADDGDSLDAARAQQELNTQLEAALEHLTDIERICFVLKHLEQWRLQEIAQELDTNIGPIKQALFRALRKLRVTMAGLRSEP